MRGAPSVPPPPPLLLVPGGAVPEVSPEATAICFPALRTSSLDIALQDRANLSPSLSLSVVCSVHLRRLFVFVCFFYRRFLTLVYSLCWCDSSFHIFLYTSVLVVHRVLLSCCFRVQLQQLGRLLEVFRHHIHHHHHHQKNLLEAKQQNTSLKASFRQPKVFQNAGRLMRF